MSRADLQSGRINQKQRTREALIEAAAELMTRGRVVNLAEVARTARVSRATAYRYFPSPDALVLETQLHRLVQRPDELLPDPDADPTTQARRVLDHLHGLVADNEMAFRQLMRSVMDRWIEAGGEVALPLRGGRRLALLEQALAPLRQPLGESAFARLVDALAMIVGMETYIAGRDICQLPAERIRDTMGWVVAVVVESAMAGRAAD